MAPKLVSKLVSKMVSKLLSKMGSKMVYKNNSKHSLFTNQRAQVQLILLLTLVLCF